jgi:DNA-binding CsgD family transcriptional regulator
VPQDRSGPKDTYAAGVIRPDALAVKTHVTQAVRAGLLNSEDADWAELYAYNDPRDFADYLRIVEATIGRDSPVTNKRVLPINRPLTAFNVTIYRLTTRIPAIERAELPTERRNEIVDDLRWLFTLLRQVLLSRLTPRVDPTEDFRQLTKWLSRLDKAIGEVVNSATTRAKRVQFDGRSLRAVVTEIHTVVAQDPKPAFEIPQDIRAWDKLTPREREIVTLLAGDLTLKQVGGTLGIGETTVKTHLEKIGAKLQVPPRKVAILRALRIL